MLHNISAAWCEIIDIDRALGRILVCVGTRCKTEKSSSQKVQKLHTSEKNFLKNFNEKLLSHRSKISKEYWSVIGSLKSKSSLPQLDVEFFWKLSTIAFATVGFQGE